jgi:hypothetical protein
LLLPTEPDIDGVLEYRGGVLYAEPGVGGTALGGSPRRALWAGIKGISLKSSRFRRRGNMATPMLMTGIVCRRTHTHEAYCFLKPSPALS